jgi:hypothetical protein
MALDSTPPWQDQGEDPFVARLLGPCPLSKADPRYDAWHTIGRFLYESEMRNQAHFLDLLSRASAEEFPGLFVDSLVARMDVCGCAIVVTVTDYKSAYRCEEALKAVGAQLFQQFNDFTADKPAFRRNAAETLLTARLAQRTAHWTAEALRLAREWKSKNAMPVTGSERVQELLAVAAESEKGTQTQQTTFGRNVDRFRKECGWSFDELAEQSGVDKKSILGHVNKNRGAYPGTKRRYATAFSRGLGRAITPDDLEK